MQSFQRVSGCFHLSELACTWSGEASHTELWVKMKCHNRWVCVPPHSLKKMKNRVMQIRVKMFVGTQVCQYVLLALYKIVQCAYAYLSLCFVWMTSYCTHICVCSLTYDLCVCVCALNISSLLLSNYIHNSNLNVQGPWWMCHPSVTCS